MNAWGDSEGRFVHATAIVGLGRQEHYPRYIGKNTRVWDNANVQGCVGDNCNIGGCVYIEQHVDIGDNCIIKNGVQVWDEVTIEDNVFVGPNATFTNDMIPRANPKYKSKEYWLPTIVKNGATIGANATIVCGITIGENAFVAAGAVVTKDVRPHELVAGNPAKHVGYVCECGRRIEKEEVHLNIYSYVCYNCDIDYIPSALENA